MLIIAVPGGMLLNEWLKLAVHRQRPFVEGPYVDWSGYSFASGHTIASHSALRTASAFSVAFAENAPLARPLHFQRGIARVCGGIQPYCVGRAFSD